MKELALSAPVPPSSRCDVETFGAIVRSVKFLGPIGQLEDPFEVAVLKTLRSMLGAMQRGREMTVGQVLRLLGKRTWGARRDAMRRALRESSRNLEAERLRTQRWARSQAGGGSIGTTDLGVLARRAVEALPEPERSIVSLHYFCGLSFAAISERVQGKRGGRLSISGVRSRSSHGLELLKGRLGR